MSHTQFDMIIVGGGIIGTACAAEAAEAGFSVAVIESDVIGSGATAAGMGHLVLMDDTDTLFDFTRYSLKLWKQLAGQLPPNTEHTYCGTIWVATDDEEMDAVEKKSEQYTSLDIQHKIVNASQLQELEPHLRDGLCGGLLVQDDSVVYAPNVARYLFAQASLMGAVGYIGIEAVEIGEGFVKLADGRQLNSKFVVNAAGHLSGKLLEGLHISGR